MVDKKLGQEPAFPLKRREIIDYTQPDMNYPTSGFVSEPIYDNVDYGGMSKRFYAACAAMQGLLSSYAGIPIKEFPVDWVASESYRLADELLKQEENGE